MGSERGDDVDKVAAEVARGWKLRARSSPARFRSRRAYVTGRSEVTHEGETSAT